MAFNINFALSQCFQDYFNPFLMYLQTKPIFKLIIPKPPLLFFKGLKSHQLSNLMHVTKFLGVI